jgi:hypothetical protein
MNFTISAWRKGGCGITPLHGSVLAAFAASLLTVHCMAQARSFDPNPWLQDYANLKQALEQRYSNLAWFGSIEGGLDLPALDRQTLAALKGATSDQDARSAILIFVRSFHDGHFSALRTASPQGEASEKPLTPEYSRQDAAGGCAALGYGSVRAAALSLPFDSLPGFNLISDGTGIPFRAGILTTGPPEVRLGIVRIPEFEDNYRALCLEAWGHSDVWDQDGKFVRGALQRIVGQGWYEALADLLGKFKAAGVAAVLVDVGNNSGGGDSGDIAPRLFTIVPLHSSSLWMSQDVESSAPFFDEQMTALRRALELDPETKQAQQALSWFTSQKEKLAQSCPLDWVWRERRAWGSETCRRLVEAGSSGGPLAYLAPNTVTDVRVARRLHWPALVTPMWGTWTGPLYVLTAGRTYSAAEGFAATLQNNHAAKILGSQTGGDGCGFMNGTKPVVLPNSGLRFRLPNCVRIRADGTDEVAGVKPNFPILPKEGEDALARAQRTLDTLYADLKATLAIR